MQPGKPQGFGVVGEDATPIFTLPGNPVSAYVSFEMFVAPALHKLTGREPVPPVLRTATLTAPLRSMRGKQQLVRASVQLDADGVRVTPVGGAGSHLVAGLAAGRRADRAGRGRHPRGPGRPGAGAAARPAGGLREVRWSASPTSTTPGAARMVDVSGKDVTARSATATGRVLVSPAVVVALRGDGVPKGDALGVARVAGIMAAKRTPDLIPLCHPLVDLRGDPRPRGARRRRGHHRHREDHRPHRRGDGGADRGLGRRADGDRHGQVHRQGRRDHRRPGGGEDRREERHLPARRRRERLRRRRGGGLQPRRGRGVRRHDRPADRRGAAGRRLGGRRAGRRTRW